jgi:NADPH2:quinone reductase
VPGNGVAGRVSAVGEGVDPGWAGRVVIAHTGEGGGSGGYAEQARVQAGQLVAVPDGVGLLEAAAVLHDGATALGLAGSTGIRPGERVLILGAAGGLGHRGRVRESQVGPAGRAGRRRGRGLQRAGLARPGRPRDRGRRAGRGLRRGRRRARRHGLRDDRRRGPVLRARAASGGFAPIGADQAARRGVTLRGIEQVQFGPGEHERLAGQALAALAAGRIRPVIGQVFPLPRAADAHLALETRSAVGKTLLTVA